MTAIAVSRVALMLLAALLLQPLSARAQSGERIAIVGSNTIGAKLMPSLVRGWAEARKAGVTASTSEDPEYVALELRNIGRGPVLVEIRSHGTGTAVPAIAEGKADLGMLSRPPTAQEAAVLTAAGMPQVASDGLRVVSLDGLAVLLHPQNRVEQVTLAQLARIFAGEIKDWSELGRPQAGRINLYARDAKSGTYDTFASLVLRPEKKDLSKDAKRFESSEDLSDSVARDVNGIGFTGLAYVRNARAVPIAGGCGLPIAAGAFTVKTEEYALSRRLFLLEGNRPDPLRADLLAYTASPAASPVIRDAGFIDLDVAVSPPDLQSRRAQSLKQSAPRDAPQATVDALIQDLRSTSRVSSTFRFATRSSRLDQKGQDDVRRLARYVAARLSQGTVRRVIVAGFSDQVGDFASNTRLSLSRAEQIRSMLTSALGPAGRDAVIETRGYGKLMPVTCDATDAEKALNRRVEIWLRS